jgi:hypothetical protein
MGLRQGFAKLRLAFVISWGDIVIVVGFSTDLAYSLYSRFQFGVGRLLRRTAVVSRLSPPNGREKGFRPMADTLSRLNQRLA